MDGPYGRLADLIKLFQNHSFNPDVLRVPQSPAPYQPLDFNGSNLSSVLETTQAIDAGSVVKIGRYLNSIVPQILFSGADRVAGYQILSFRSPIGSELNDPDFNASSMSDGTLRALAALTAVFQNVHEDQDLSLVAIEEPETALHPAAMRALVSAFDAATMRTQILLTTHSPDLLDAEEIKPENVRIVQMIDGQTVIGPIDEASVEIVRRNLDTLGGLERNDSLHIDFDDLQRQMALAEQASDGQP